MDGFIDIYSHILPEMDEGSKNVEQTINMVKIAYEEFVCNILFHCSVCSELYNPEWI